MDATTKFTSEEIYARMPYPNLEYPPEILEILAANITKETYEVFKLIWNSRNKGGIIKKESVNAIPSRRKYDRAIAILEGAGFIFSIDDGRSLRYFPTTRGAQLKDYLQIRKAKLLKGELNHDKTGSTGAP
jgi:hypothetical protein